VALTADQITLLRKMIEEENDADGWSEIALNLIASQYINADGTYNLNGIAGKVWGIKAASYVESVDTAESGSSRKASQMFDHAIEMAKFFNGSDGDEDNATLPAPRSTRVVRATREG
jgi:hypothetical protein